METIYLLLLLSVGMHLSAQIPPPPPPPLPNVSTENLSNQAKLEQETSLAFYTYTTALKERDAANAASSLSLKSWKYYKELQGHIIYSGPEELEKLNLFTQKAILKARLCFDEDSLAAWDTQTFFYQLTNYGYLGEDWSLLDGVNPTRVQQFGDSAQTRILYQRSLAQRSYSPQYIHYYKESGKWKLDISPIIMIAAEDFRRKFEIEWGHSPKKYLLHQIEQEIDGEISKNIWKPLLKRK